MIKMCPKKRVRKNFSGAKMILVLQWGQWLPKEKQGMGTRDGTESRGYLRFSDMYSHMSFVFLNLERKSMIFCCYDVACWKSIF